MRSCQYLVCLATLSLLLTVVLAMPTAEAKAEIEAQHVEDEPKFVVISEDIIPDVENTTQKVIRVNPLDLPIAKEDPTGSMDSSLYKIQPLLPPYRNYVNSKRMRKQRPFPGDSPIIRRLTESKPQKPKKKHLHFLYNQEALNGGALSKRMRVHVAPGAYPVFYAVSKSNGRFGKFPLKNFRNEAEFTKYLVKSKLEPIEKTQRYDS